ncbi:glycosyltransferase family protein [Flavobacterium saccharophilum]|uniref:Glycosyltransferase, GT2 family n=1 Tax=Flavobacterium saccharophilum TaxID=29534 RepID=A0A1M7K9T8_9FLAO|nr:hypothetical protein [Flavobacterium saccharophilum]SHM61951.1 hypothetical protein SAMN05444366_3707 [Flavobacterium saccharophilum]
MDLVLVVLYKQKVSESSTLLTLINCKNHLTQKMLFVWDNSPNPLDEHEIIFLENQFKNFKYLNSQDNRSLSEVYNTVIKQIKFNKIFIFDQDTSLTDEYFELVDSSALNNTDVGIFLPFVKNKNRVVSPLRFSVINFDHSKIIKKGRVLAKNKTAFASGLCIKEWIFKRDNIWFDQNLSFYGIDYKFILDYGDFNRYMYVIDYELKHSLSFTEEETKEVKIKRFDSNIAASFYLANARFNFFQKVIIVIRSLFVSFKMSLKYRDSIFFMILFKNLKFFGRYNL